jgi:hypothetical protein
MKEAELENQTKYHSAPACLSINMILPRLQGYDSNSHRLERSWMILSRIIQNYDRLCGLVVRVSGYISRGPGFVPGASRFSEKQRVWNRVLSAS